MSKRIARHVHIPPTIDREDAEQDAALVLIELRAKWDEARVAERSVEQQEKLVVSWGRLRLIDKYATDFARSARVKLWDNMDVLPRPERAELDGPDAAVVDAVVSSLSPRQAEAVRRVLLGDETQEVAAAGMGVSQAAVCLLLRRAAVELRELLAGFKPEGS